MSMTIETLINILNEWDTLGHEGQIALTLMSEGSPLRPALFGILEESDEFLTGYYVRELELMLDFLAVLKETKAVEGVQDFIDKVEAALEET